MITMTVEQQAYVGMDLDTSGGCNRYGNYRSDSRR